VLYGYTDTVINAEITVTPMTPSQEALSHNSTTVDLYRTICCAFAVELVVRGTMYNNPQQLEVSEWSFDLKAH